MFRLNQQTTKIKVSSGKDQELIYEKTFGIHKNHERYSENAKFITKVEPHVN